MREIESRIENYRVQGWEARSGSKYLEPPTSFSAFMLSGSLIGAFCHAKDTANTDAAMMVGLMNISD